MKNSGCATEFSVFYRTLIEDLRCTYCGSGFKIDFVLQSLNSGLTDGVIQCDCYEYPVVSGIAVLRQMSPVNSTQNTAVDCIRNHDPKGALQWMLLNGSAGGVPSLEKLRAVDAAGARLKKRIFNLFGSRALQHRVDPIPLHQGFGAALRASRPRGYADFFYHRFANPSLLGAIPPLAVFCDQFKSKKRGRLLDLLSGVGHTSAIINSLCAGMEVIAADSDFVNLYLLRNFVAPQAACLCIDAELNLPLADSSLDGLFCLDGLHYIRSKAALLHELDRVINEDGIWLFAHLHNSSGFNENPGTPLSAKGYATRFAFGQQRLFSEVEILRQFQEKGSLDLSKQPDMDSIASGDALTLIGARRAFLWKPHLDIENALCCSPEMLAFNPIYEIEEVAEGLALNAVWPSNLLQQECNRHFTVLPEHLYVQLKVVAEIKALKTGGLISDSVRELLRSFILVNLPSCYSRKIFLQ